MGTKLDILLLIVISGTWCSIAGIVCLLPYSSTSAYSLIALLFVDIIFCVYWGCHVYWLYDHYLYVYSFISERFQLVYLSEFIVVKYRFLRNCIIWFLISMDLIMLANVCYVKIYYFHIGADYILSKLFVFCVILGLIMHLTFFRKPLDHLMLVPRAQMPINNFLDFLKCVGWFILISFFISLFVCIVNIIRWTCLYVGGECLAIFYVGGECLGIIGLKIVIDSRLSMVLVLIFVFLVNTVLSFALFDCLHGNAVSYYFFEVFKRCGNFLKDILIDRGVVKNCLLIYSVLLAFVVFWVFCPGPVCFDFLLLSVKFSFVDVPYFAFFLVLKIILLCRVHLYEKDTRPTA